MATKRFTTPTYSEVLTSTAVNNTRGFGGMYLDLYTGFYDTGRIYSPTMQTFLTPDPAQADPNTYRYGGNDPADATDPTGLGGEQNTTTPGPNVDCSTGGGSAPPMADGKPFPISTAIWKGRTVIIVSPEMDKAERVSRFRQEASAILRKAALNIRSLSAKSAPETTYLSELDKLKGYEQKLVNMAYLAGLQGEPSEDDFWRLVQYVQSQFAAKKTGGFTNSEYSLGMIINIRQYHPMLDNTMLAALDHYFQSRCEVETGNGYAWAFYANEIYHGIKYVGLPVPGESSAQRHRIHVYNTMRAIGEH